jgi:hypothetical protein
MRITIEMQDTEEIFQLPCVFKYKRALPKKRQSVKNVAKGAFVQTGVPAIMYEGVKFKFAMDALTGCDAKFFYDLWNTNRKFYFNGSENERYLVTICDLDVERKCMYMVKGMMLIHCLEQEPDFGHLCRGDGPCDLTLT